ncbi:di-heme oxidoredictase family protein, partial [Pseudomonas sp.]
GFLHDGRARSPSEAILWHGGEAQAARERFVALPRQAREALLVFLGSL